MLKKFNMEEKKHVSTPMIIGFKLSKMDPSPSVDHTIYRYMVESLIYLATTKNYIININNNDDQVFGFMFQI